MGTYISSNVQRKIAATLAATGSVGAALLCLAPGIAGDLHAQIHAVHCRGVPANNFEEINRFQDTVMDDMKLDADEKEKLTFYNCLGFGFHSSGFLKSWVNKYCTNSFVGVPHHFQNIRMDDMDSAELKVDEEALDWDKVATADLMSSLLLSDNCKKFILAKKIVYLKSSYPFYHSALTLFTTSSCYVISRYINVRAQLPHLIQRMGIFVAIALSQAIVYTLGKDSLNYQNEVKCDANAAQINVEYAEGGIEFYQKIIQRNLAGRKLSSVAATMYTPGGNETVFIRVPFPSNTERVDRLKKIVEVMKNTSAV